jgi:dihydrodipicolinate synthase/N-acetylneuraminate lyase
MKDNRPKLTRKNWTGPWAGIPVAWNQDDQFDEAVYRADVARCCQAGIPGVYTGGSTGEFFATDFDEFQRITIATIEECHTHDTPAMIGCTATYTKAAANRAAFAAQAGADAVQVALPFWAPLAPHEILPFFKTVAAAAPGLPLSVYDTSRAKHCLTLEEHQAAKDALPQYTMVKATGASIGTQPDGCAALSQFVNVFVSETLWTALGPHGAAGCCSAMVYWNPRLILDFWKHVETQNWPALDPYQKPIDDLHRFLADHFGPKGYTDTAYDRLVTTATGFLNVGLNNRAPYTHPTPDDVKTLRQWLQQNFPELVLDA